MSKITNDSLTRSGTGCFIAVPATVGVKGLTCYGVTVFSSATNLRCSNTVPSPGQQWELIHVLLWECSSY